MNEARGHAVPLHHLGNPLTTYLGSIMDYEKPEALNPHIFPHAGHQSPQPDGEATLLGFDEPVAPEDRREFRGDSLWYVCLVCRCFRAAPSLRP